MKRKEKNAKEDSKQTYLLLLIFEDIREETNPSPGLIISPFIINEQDSATKLGFRTVIPMEFFLYLNDWLSERASEEEKGQKSF